VFEGWSEHALYYRYTITHSEELLPNRSYTVEVGGYWLGQVRTTDGATACQYEPYYEPGCSGPPCEYEPMCTGDGSESESGDGCSASGSPGAQWLLIALLIPLLARRRRAVGTAP
jgi:uncharacterized protein (TIGR03382 family)